MSLELLFNVGAILCDSLELLARFNYTFVQAKGQKDPLCTPPSTLIVPGSGVRRRETTYARDMRCHCLVKCAIRKWKLLPCASIQGIVREHLAQNVFGTRECR